MDKLSDNSLKEALEISKKMLESSQNGEWDNVIKLMKARDDLLINADLQRFKEAKDIDSVMQELLDINSALSFFAEEEKEKCFQLCISLKKGKSASKVYNFS